MSKSNPISSYLAPLIIGSGSRNSSGRSFIAMDDSTESEAESSYHGWSDAGWPSEVATPRRSDSSDEIIRPPPLLPLATSSSQSLPNSIEIPPASHNNGIPNGRAISFSSTGTTHHRRGTTGSHRPSLHSLGSNVSLDTIAGQGYPSTILTMDDQTTPSISTSAFQPIPYMSPPSYTDAAGGYTYPRSRRKSLGQIPASTRTPSETSEDNPYLVNGNGNGNGIGHVHGKGKRNSRHRGGSFSYLPFHRRRRASSNIWPRWFLHPRKPYPSVDAWKILAVIFGSLLTMFWAVNLFNHHFQLVLEAAIAPRRWTTTNLDDIQPLKGCFDSHQISPDYIAQTKAASPFNQLLAPGLSLKHGLHCYDFAATIKPLPENEMKHITYHTYWRSDLIPFGERQTDTLTAFLATQPLTHSKLILWTNGVEFLKQNTHVRHILEKWGNYIEVRQVDMTVLTKGTELEGKLSTIDKGGLFDERAWVDGDAVRLLALWHFGGIWMDMDQILTRDLHPLAETEFVTQWDCFDKIDFVLNGALMHFRRHSPYLCEAFHIMASSPLPRPNTFTWGSHLYTKLHRRLIASHIAPFTVLPWCFADPRNCRNDNSFPNPFKGDPEFWGGRRWDGHGEVGRSGREILEERVGHVWTVHLHNQWTKSFPVGGWVYRLLQGYKRQVRLIEEYARGGGDVDLDSRNLIVVTKMLPTPSAEEFMSGSRGDVVPPLTAMDDQTATKEVPPVVNLPPAPGAVGKGSNHGKVAAAIMAGINDHEPENDVANHLKTSIIQPDEEVLKLVNEVLAEEAALEEIDD